eukprot:m.137865 g.137865  ORF g.137865 m.137865 type:complete len:357 (+) comp16613_c0_seq4:553-1623(+)
MVCSSEMELTMFVISSSRRLIICVLSCSWPCCSALNPVSKASAAASSVSSITVSAAKPRARSSRPLSFFRYVDWLPRNCTERSCSDVASDCSTFLVTRKCCFESTFFPLRPITPSFFSALWKIEVISEVRISMACSSFIWLSNLTWFTCLLCSSVSSFIFSLIVFINSCTSSTSSTHSGGKLCRSSDVDVLPLSSKGIKGTLSTSPSWKEFVMRALRSSSRRLANSTVRLRKSTWMTAVSRPPVAAGPVRPELAICAVAVAVALACEALMLLERGFSLEDEARSRYSCLSELPSTLTQAQQQSGVAVAAVAAAPLCVQREASASTHNTTLALCNFVHPPARSRCEARTKQACSLSN